MYFDYTYLILLPPMLLAAWASWRIKHIFHIYSASYVRSGITAAQAVRQVLNSNGLHHVQIRQISGHLTDYYDPQKNIICLSASVYASSSTAAIGVACHEAGHAIQHARQYRPATLRRTLVPITNIGSQAGIWIFLAGLLLTSLSVQWVFVCYVGIALFSLTAIFQLVTLSTEFDASRRAMEALTQSGQFTQEELAQSKKVLSAAALTYVAALATALGHVLRLVLILGRRRGRR